MWDQERDTWKHELRKVLRDVVAMSVRAEAEPKDEHSHHAVLVQAFEGYDLDRHIKAVILLAQELEKAGQKEAILLVWTATFEVASGR